MEFGNNKKQKKAVGLNITSLVDVLFIILIFVLVSTTFLEQPSLNIELPEAKTAGLHRIEEIVISISEDGELFLNDQQISKEKLGSLLQMHIKKEGEDIPVLKDCEKPVVLKADKKVSYGLVIEVMDIMRGVGVKKLVALTVPSDHSAQ